MSKDNMKSGKKSRFWLILAICSQVFVILVGAGFLWLWDYMAAFEASRPQNAISGYVATITPKKLSQSKAALPEGIDLNIQSQDDARQAIAESMDVISYAKNTKLSTDDKMVYMLISRGKTLGQVAMTVVRTDKYGFEYWSVTEETYDFSYLLGKSTSITVPEGYTVYANGVALDESYITEQDIHYASVEEYYAQYDLPTMCTYTAGPVMGPLTLTVEDPDGVPVEITKDTDMEQFLKNCTQQEEEAVEKFLSGFVKNYTNYISVSGGQDAMQRNYNALIAYIVPGSKLAQRMVEAVEGLVWVTDRYASVRSITMDRCLRLEEGRWMCDFTYVVDTRDYNGKVESVNSVQIIIVQTANGLKAESMVSK